MSTVEMIERKLAEAESSLERQDLTGAEKLFRELVLSKPGMALFHWKLGYVLLDLSNPKDAIAEFQQALSIESESIAAIGGLAHCYMALQDWPNAELAVRHRLKLKDSPQFWVFLATILIELERYSDAIECCQRVISAGTTSECNSEAYYNLGRACRLENDPESAISAFTHAIEIDGNYSDAYRELGLTNYSVGDMKSAKPFLEKCVRLDPQDGWGHLYLALCLENLDDLDAAEMHFRTALRVEPDNEFFEQQYAEFKDQRPIDDLVLPMVSAPNRNS